MVNRRPQEAAWIMRPFKDRTIMLMALHVAEGRGSNEPLLDENSIPTPEAAANTLSTPRLAAVSDGHTRLSRARLKSAKRAYVTRRASLRGPIFLSNEEASLEAGDLVLASVVSIGQHQRIELPSGRRAALFPGDEIIVACGARYAVDQFEAKVPEKIGPCSLVAAGGVAAIPVAKHGRMKSATRIRLIGALCDVQGRNFNLRDWAIPAPAIAERPRAHVVVVAGTSMNAGKTTTAASIIRGLRRAKLAVNACKLTGTGAGCDAWKFSDAGAKATFDFTDAGHVSTAGLSTWRLDRVAATLLAACDDGADVIVAEIADGLLQAETAALLQSPTLKSMIDSLVFAASDPMAAGAGVDLLRRWGYEPSAVSGLLTASPTAVREAQSITDIPVVTTDFLQNDPAMSSFVFRHADPRGALDDACIA